VSRVSAPSTIMKKIIAATTISQLRTEAETGCMERSTMREGGAVVMRQQCRSPVGNPALGNYLGLTGSHTNEFPLSPSGYYQNDCASAGPRAELHRPLRSSRAGPPGCGLCRLAEGHQCGGPCSADGRARRARATGGQGRIEPVDRGGAAA